VHPVASTILDENANFRSLVSFYIIYLMHFTMTIAIDICLPLTFMLEKDNCVDNFCSFLSILFMVITCCIDS